MWGEHGKGYRSEYGPAFFGEELFAELRKIKGVFDPLNRMNPGKICTPWQSQDLLVSVDGQKRAYLTGKSRLWCGKVLKLRPAVMAMACVLTMKKTRRCVRPVRSQKIAVIALKGGQV